MGAAGAVFIEAGAIQCQQCAAEQAVAWRFPRAPPGQEQSGANGCNRTGYGGPITRLRENEEEIELDELRPEDA
jgi:hypothetical protein